MTVFLIMATTVFLWASAFVGIRIGLHGYSGGSLALLRYLVASMAMLVPYCCLKTRQRIAFRDIPQLILLGVLGFAIYNVALNYGEVTVPAGIASFIVGLMPVISMIAAIFILKEKVARWSWFGIAISLAGLLVIVAGEHAGIKFDYGVVYTFVAALVLAFYTILQKPLLKKYHPIEIVSYAIWSGTFVMLVFAPDLWRHLHTAHWQATAAVVYMGIFPGAIAYLLWGYALQKVDACQAVLVTYALPIIATLLGWLVLNEVPATISLIGGLITLIGAIVARQCASRK